MGLRTPEGSLRRTLSPARISLRASWSTLSCGGAGAEEEEEEVEGAGSGGADEGAAAGAGAGGAGAAEGALSAMVELVACGRAESRPLLLAVPLRLILLGSRSPPPRLPAPWLAGKTRRSLQRRHLSLRPQQQLAPRQSPQRLPHLVVPRRCASSSSASASPCAPSPSTSSTSASTPSLPPRTRSRTTSRRRNRPRPRSSRSRPRSSPSCATKSAGTPSSTPSRCVPLAPRLVLDLR